MEGRGGGGGDERTLNDWLELNNTDQKVVFAAIRDHIFVVAVESLEISNSYSALVRNSRVKT